MSMSSNYIKTTLLNNIFLLLFGGLVQTLNGWLGESTKEHVGFIVSACNDLCLLDVESHRKYISSAMKQ